jgi:uncharacterized protein YdaU (DUF1376 family)
MTSRCHWMPFYPCDYLGDTLNLTTLEHGAYILLIMHYWQKGGLPDDEREFATICRLPAYRWTRMRDKISRLFHDGWKHKRIDEELAKAGALREKRAEAGRAGADRTNARYRSAPQKRATNGANPLKNNDANSAFADTSTVTPIRDKDISHRRAQAREGASRREREGFRYAEKPMNASQQMVVLMDQILEKSREQRSNGDDSKASFHSVCLIGNGNPHAAGGLFHRS